MAPLAFVPRPWLELYGVHIRVRKTKRDIQVEQAPIQKALPDELLVLVLSHLPPYLLGKVACVCSQLRDLADAPRLWQRACQEAFQTTIKEPAVMTSLLKTTYMGSWRRLFLERPHLRFDGLYVSRNTYVKTGVVEWATRNPVHLVTYYRYYRFFADGTFLYRTTPLPVSKAARTLQRPRTSGASRNKWSEEQVYSGRYLLRGNKLHCVVVYDNSRSTEIRSVMKLRSTHAGANNRLDIERIFSFDRDLGTESNLVAAAVDPEDASSTVAGASREHRRGTACCVHVPWEQVATTPLNLTALQMDYYMPG